MVDGLEPLVDEVLVLECEYTEDDSNVIQLVPSLLQMMIEDPLVDDEGCSGVTTDEEAGAEVISVDDSLADAGAFEDFEISPEGV